MSAYQADAQMCWGKLAVEVQGNPELMKQHELCACQKPYIVIWQRAQPLGHSRTFPHAPLAHNIQCKVIQQHAYVGFVLNAGALFLQALNQQLSQFAHSPNGVVDAPIVPVTKHLHPDHKQTLQLQCRVCKVNGACHRPAVDCKAIQSALNSWSKLFSFAFS